MNKLLIEDYPLMVLPRLAQAIGLHEAIFLQQLHYWLNGSKKLEVDGHKWIYNTMKQWSEQFPYCSERTLARVISSLTKRGLLLTANYNRRGGDQTKWYTIDYEALNQLELPELSPKRIPGNSSSGQNPAQSKQQALSRSATSGTGNLPKWQTGKVQDTVNTPRDRDTSLPKWQTASDNNPVDCQNDRGSMPKCQSETCQDGKGSMSNCQPGTANMAVPLPENNNRETAKTTEETTNIDRAIPITARTSSLPMEEIKLLHVQQELLLFASKIGMSEGRMIQCVEAHGITLVRRQVKLLQRNLELKKPIKNPAGWLIKALKENYQDSAARYAALNEEEKTARRVAGEEWCRRMEEKYAEMDRAEKKYEPDPDSEFCKKYHPKFRKKANPAAEDAISSANL